MSYGSLGSDVGDLLGDSATTQDMFARGSADLVKGFYATAILMLALMCSGYAISQAIRKGRSSMSLAWSGSPACSTGCRLLKITKSE